MTPTTTTTSFFWFFCPTPSALLLALGCYAALLRIRPHVSRTLSSPPTRPNTPPPTLQILLSYDFPLLNLPSYPVVAVEQALIRRLASFSFQPENPAHVLQRLCLAAALRRLEAVLNQEPRQDLQFVVSVVISGEPTPLVANPIQTPLNPLV